MAYRTIRLHRDERGVATLWLAQPAKHNILGAESIAELTDAADRLAAEESLRCVVLTGEGESFCAGGDLSWMRAQIDGSRAERRAEAGKLAAMLGRIHALDLPVIARVNGQAYGGGLGLISVADIAIGAETARFGLTETRLGLIPATIAPYVIARLGPARAGEIFASSRRFGAEEAVRLGLLTRSATPETLDPTVEAEIAPYLQAAPGAVRDAKRLLRRLSPPIAPEAVEASVAALADRWETAEAQAGVTAFLEKRPMPWSAG